MERYDPQQIEPKWQQVWEDARAFYVSNPAAPDPAEREKFYMLEMLPYPSGTLHMGHVLNYTLGDVITHYRRRNGFSEGPVARQSQAGRSSSLTRNVRHHKRFSKGYAAANAPRCSMTRRRGSLGWRSVT